MMEVVHDEEKRRRSEGCVSWLCRGRGRFVDAAIISVIIEPGYSVPYYTAVRDSPGVPANHTSHNATNILYRIPSTSTAININETHLHLHRNVDMEKKLSYIILSPFNGRENKMNYVITKKFGIQKLKIPDKKKTDL